MKDSNPHIQSQSLLCYLYTNPLYSLIRVARTGIIIPENKNLSRGFFEKNNINFTKKDVAEPENLSSLLKLGGKAQIPFLDDPQNGVSMYESDDIIEYAKNRG